MSIIPSHIAPRACATGSFGFFARFRILSSVHVQFSIAPCTSRLCHRELWILCTVSSSFLSSCSVFHRTLHLAPVPQVALDFRQSFLFFVMAVPSTMLGYGRFSSAPRFSGVACGLTMGLLMCGLAYMSKHASRSLCLVSFGSERQELLIADD
jgi:hypothetical protein